ncbi:heparinase II/III-family protein [Chelativorans salis]|uniref:Heparinase II/III-family protein n=1 Tax=Chelativorans salis TaxID=2978478 RepID=A0ABT2LW68_9HYPH|nr:heparinase II/III-family protein [Chelativorans sp. EGI FJ00035]MCT7377628.1 heparinase II/III-family protein [Chelativorans sp. EGI FJ00035]
MVPLRLWNVRRIDAALAHGGIFAPFAPGADRKGWAAIAVRAGEGAVTLLQAQASADAAALIPALPASLYLDFQRTGRREAYEDAQRRRRNMLYRLVLAECLAWQGTFLDAISDIIWARLEETNWAWPAHAHTLDAPNRPTLDLAAAMTALDLAEIDYLLGERLDENLRAHIRGEVDRRAISPFLDRHDHWWLHSTGDKQVNNWTAVCVAGVAGAACYLEPDRARLAEVLARGMACLADYLDTFDSRGGSTEGPDYWSYGFGNFVVLAQLVDVRTGGALRLLDDPFVREIAQFPLRTILAPGCWVSFSDSDLEAGFHPGLLAYLAERLALPELTQIGVANDFAVDHFNQFAWPLRQYLWPLPEEAVSFTGGTHDWFPKMGWMISRLDPADPASLKVAVKGGHNAEMHNQNDVGSLIVMTRGHAVVTDPGRGRYSKAYFGAERYENLMTSSHGHSVPVVDGHLQRPGGDFAARVVEHQHDAAGDRLLLDMTAAYPAEAGLASLHRTLEIDRRPPGGAITLTDEFAFADRARSFESVLVTTGDAEFGGGTVVMRAGEGALEVSFDPESVSVRVERHPDVEKQYAPSVDVTRVIFALTNSEKAGQVSLIMRPLR